jgi:hypothetical protein
MPRLPTAFSTPCYTKTDPENRTVHRTASTCSPTRRGTTRPPHWRARAVAWLVLWAICIGWFTAPAHAEPPQLSQFAVTRSDDGLLIDFTARFELPRSVEDALLKGVPLHFVAEATLFRERWYWRDKEVSRVSRVWRLAYQPLTRSYRVSFGGFNQRFDSLAEAVAAVRRVSRWKLAEPNQIESDDSQYVEFSYKLDTTLLPRPMQIGIGGQPDWNLQIDRAQRVAGP